MLVLGITKYALTSSAACTLPDLVLVHQFFINFNQATAVFTLYTLATLVAYTVISSKTSTIVAGTGPGADWGGGNVDVQTIVVIAL